MGQGQGGETFREHEGGVNSAEFCPQHDSNKDGFTSLDTFENCKHGDFNLIKIFVAIAF